MIASSGNSATILQLAPDLWLVPAALHYSNASAVKKRKRRIRGYPQV